MSFWRDLTDEVLRRLADQEERRRLQARSSLALEDQNRLLRPADPFGEGFAVIPRPPSAPQGLLDRLKGVASGLGPALIKSGVAVGLVLVILLGVVLLFFSPTRRQV